VVGIAVCYCGDLAEGERVLRPLRAFGSPSSTQFSRCHFPRCRSLSRVLSGSELQLLEVDIPESDQRRGT